MMEITKECDASVCSVKPTTQMEPQHATFHFMTIQDKLMNSICTFTDPFNWSVSTKLNNNDK